MGNILRYNLVDVFTDTPLAGNPLAVFTKGQGLSTETMQAIAREMNLSETVFFLPPENGGHARIRIFTPYIELPFAGHPVLGSAWVLGQPMEMQRLVLETGAGNVELEMFRDGGRLQMGRMTQPLPEFSAFSAADELYRALGHTPKPGTLLPIVEAKNGPRHVLVELGSRELLDQISPDFSSLARVSPQAGVYAFAQADDQCFARYFAPSFGINEDPATGSAAGPLGAHLVLSKRLESERTLIVTQGLAMGRPSTLRVEAKVESDALVRVTVAGSAVVIARGELLP